MQSDAKPAPALRVLVLGSAAGGGSPQWNCRCRVCRCVRRGAEGTSTRTQSSIAVSADGERWVLVNASPDLRRQLLDNRQLWPAEDGRHSPIAAAVLTGAEVDQVAGLLNLREGHRFAIYGAPATLEALDASAIFGALDAELVSRRALELDTPFEPADADGESLGVEFDVFSVPGKVALYQEESAQTPQLDAEDDRNVGLRITARGSQSSLYYIPGCAAFTDRLAARLDGAAAVMFDGTLWRDDELIAQGLGHKTGRRMGHVSMSGDGGSLQAFDGLDITRRIFVHLNNSNPVLLPNTPERRAVERAGWEVAYDGMELTL
ncbi:pyrroloquinoline quinone biosynthesis protein PqqB [Persicimonas caeni]|uniref:Coenzyme PQQ synthesis protein B n=1 Tax=Persicimonas caeni TaxID=2292766 RepID=A0A4Y6PXN1_PERCE|nr:pyrroloquinoline quinone biosynthesis protein PqqB [Persicimonas caeni]QDG53023.1 pyrroloquinoline quinone biosynthesis protein PqqB [Persicimonas caeni]QED34245.1 pyrroloquinoline quinone biosynthesis protein PqqB [Persicimonas caeni]